MRWRLRVEKFDELIEDTLAWFPGCYTRRSSHRFLCTSCHTRYTAPDHKAEDTAHPYLFHSHTPFIFLSSLHSIILPLHRLRRTPLLRRMRPTLNTIHHEMHNFLMVVMFRDLPEMSYVTVSRLWRSIKRCTFPATCHYRQHAPMSTETPLLDQRPVLTLPDRIKV